jgi:hypothetical protein
MQLSYRQFGVMKPRRVEMKTTFAVCLSSVAIGLAHFTLLNSGSGFYAEPHRDNNIDSGQEARVVESEMTMRKLSIVNADGAEVIRLGTGADGKPRMGFFNPKNGEMSIAIGIDEEGASTLSFLDSQGRITCTMFGLPTGEASLLFYAGDKDAGVLQLGVGSEENSAIVFRDISDNMRLGLSTMDGRAQLVLFDSNEKERIVHSIGESGIAQVVVRDGEGAEVHKWSSGDKR